MKKVFAIYIWTAAASLNMLQAQIFTLLPGTDVTIKKGTVVFADSLILTPSSDFTLSNTRLSRNIVVNHAIPSPYIARVYQFSNTSNPFSGSVQINYRDGAELKGLTEAELKLNIFNGAMWKNYKPASLDATNNYVNTTGLNCVRLKELTLGVDCPPPTIQCNADITVNATAGTCGAAVCYKPPVVKGACGNVAIKQIEGLASGAVFPVGVTTNTFVANSLSGQADTCSFTVTVKDKQPPLIKNVNANPSYLWPPDHSMRNVTIDYNAWDNCGTVSSSLAVSSTEPVYGTGHKDKAPDWVIVDNHHLQLRAEKSDHGNGRIYTITITTTDAAGNTSSETTRVTVQHHRNGGHWNASNDEDEDYGDQHLDCKVIPNPSSHHFNLQVTSASDEKIEIGIMDISGRVLSRLSTVKDKTIRFGDDLRPGLYLVEIKQGQQQKTIKVIKQ